MTERMKGGKTGVIKPFYLFELNKNGNNGSFTPHRGFQKHMAAYCFDTLRAEDKGITPFKTVDKQNKVTEHNAQYAL